MKYLLNPKVFTKECRMLTQAQCMKLLRALKSRKFGSKIYAVDVEEIITTESTTIKSGLSGDRWQVVLPKGNYFNVHVEYVL